MKKFLSFFFVAVLAALLAFTLFACDDDGGQTPPPEDVPTLSYKGGELFDMTAEQVKALAEDGAAVMSKDTWSAGASIDLGIGGEVYTLRADLNVSADRTADEAAVELISGGSVRLGLYLADGVLYVDDGAAVRAYDIFGDGTGKGFDLAGTMAKLSGIVEYTEGAVSDSVAEALADPLVNLVKGLVIDKYNGTLTGSEAELVLPLGEIVHKFSGIIAGLEIGGIKVSDLGGVLGTLLGASWEDLTDPNAEIDLSSLAKLKINVTFGERFPEKVALTYILGDTEVSLSVHDIVLTEGRRNILPDTLAAAKDGGIRISAESMLGGKKVYTDIRASFTTKDTEDIELIMTVGPAPGKDDYIYAVYDGDVKVNLTTVAQDGTTNPNANPSTLGAFNVRVSDEFMRIVAHDNIAAMEDLPGLKFYAAIDLEEIIAGIGELLGGTEAVAAEGGESAPEEGASSFDPAIITKLLGWLNLENGIGVDLDRSFIDFVAELVQGESYDPDADLAAAIDGLVTTLADTLGISLVDPEAAREDSGRFVPYYRTLSFVKAIAGDAVVQGLGLDEFIDAMTLSLGVGVDLEDGFGLSLSADLSTSAETDGGQSVVSAGESVFTVSFCDAPDIPAAHARFNLTSTESANGGYTTTVTGGIPDIAGEEYLNLFLSASGTSTDALDFLLGFATLGLPVVFSYGLIG